MASQTGKNMWVAFYTEGASFNTAPGAGVAAEKLRINPSPGLNLTRATVLPGEIRSDLQTQMGRLGSNTVAGSYNCDLSINSFDSILEAIFRSTWVAAVAITQATMTSITTTTSTIVAAAGSWITQGVRVGDIVRLTGHSTAANNDINLTVKTVSALTITVVGTPLTLDAAPDATFTLTILKKLMNAAVPVRRSFYIDEYNQDIDMSEVYGGCRFSGFTIRGTPDGMATIEIRVVGASQTALAAGGTSPYYTAATLRTDIGLVFVDASIVRNGLTVLSTCTSFELTCDLNAQGLPIIGGTTTPDVFDNEMTMSGSLSMLREDLTYITALGAETEYSLQILLVEPDATDPIDCLNLYLPRIKFTGVDTPLGQDGGMVQTCPFMVGMQPAVAASGIDETMMTICTETPA